MPCKGFTVEKREKGRYFTKTYGESALRGPYSSIASVTQMIARELKQYGRRLPDMMRSTSPASAGLFLGIGPR